MKPVLRILVSVLAVVLALPVAGLALAQQGGVEPPPPPPKVDIEPEGGKTVQPMAVFAAAPVVTGLMWKVDGQTASKNAARELNVRFKIYDIEFFQVWVGEGWKNVDKSLEIKITGDKGKILRTITVRRHSSGQGKPDQVKWITKKGTDPESEVPHSETADPNGFPPEFFVNTKDGEEWGMKADGKVVQSGKARIWLIEGE